MSSDVAAIIHAVPNVNRVELRNVFRASDMFAQQIIRVFADKESDAAGIAGDIALQLQHAGLPWVEIEVVQEYH